MKKICGVIISSIMLLASTGAWADPEPYNSTRLLPAEPYYLPNSWNVLNELTARQGTVFIDIGSENGGAARYIAQNTNDEVTVYSVDNWEGSGEYQHFLSNVVQENTANKIVSFRMTSAEAANALKIVGDVIYINASNPGTIEGDILLWFSHLTSNGAILGDNWNLPEVELAVIKAASELGLNVKIIDSLWIIHRQ